MTELLEKSAKSAKAVKAVYVTKNEPLPGREERRMMKACTGPMPSLDYPCVVRQFKNRKYRFLQYVIPDEEKADVIRKLWMFDGAERLDMDATYLDIHCNKTFKLRDAIITREDDCNFIMSPYYAEAGGTLLDMTEYTEKVQKKAEENGVLIVANHFKQEK